MKKLSALLVALGLLLAHAPAAIAAQGSGCLPTTGTVSGLSLVTAMNNAIAALISSNSGASAPATDCTAVPIKGQLWLDTTSSTLGVLKIYSGSAWIRVGAVDTTAGVWTPPIGGGVTSLAAAATVDLCSVAQNYIAVTAGAGTITSFGTSTCAIGSVKVLRFSTAVTLTYNALTLTIPGSVDRAIAIGDTLTVAKGTSTRWDVVGYDSAPPAPTGDSLPVGVMLCYGGFALPAKYDWCDGGAATRGTHTDLVAAFTSVQTVTHTSGNPTLTGFSDTDQFAVGMDVEGTKVPAGATILSKTTSTVTLSANASSSGSAAVSVFAFGGGNGSTTIDLPDGRGRVLAGRDNLGGTPVNRLTVASPNVCAGTGLGVACGNQQGTLAEAQLPVVSKTVTSTAAGAHSHTYDDHGSGTTNFHVGDLGSTTVADTNVVSRTTDTAATHTHNVTVAFGSGGAHTRLQPTLIVNCIVKVDP